MDVCLITQAHLSMNPRVVKEADALEKAGYSVGVISPDYSAWGRRADEEFRNRRWRVLERPRYGPLAPLSTRVREILRRGIAVSGTKNLGITDRRWVEAAWHPVVPALRTSARKHKASLYVAHLVSSLPAAASAAGLHRAAYAFDAEDYHPGDLPDVPESAYRNRLLDRIERLYLPGCAYISAASPLIAEAYSRRYNIPGPRVVLNTFPRGRAAASPSRGGSANPGPSIYWFSQTIGPGRGIECAIAALSQCQSRPYLYLRGQVAAGYQRVIEDIASDHGVTGRVYILPPDSPAMMERLAAPYDLGLSGEPGITPNNSIALGNKLFSYLLAGVPIVMSTSTAHLAFAAELGEAACLFATNDSGDLARAIDSLLLNPDRLEQARRAAWRLGQTRYNWETESKHFLDLVESVIGPPRRDQTTPPKTEVDRKSAFEVIGSKLARPK